MKIHLGKRQGMSQIFLPVFLFFGGLHYYILTKARAAFSPGVMSTFLLILFMLVILMAPLLGYTAENLGFETFARVLTFIGYTWMGLVFLFSVVSLVIDLSRLVFFIGGLLLRKEILHLNPLWAFLLPLFIALAAGTYGFFEAQDIRTERITVKSPKIPREADQIRIVQITDVHLGMISREERLSKIIKAVKEAKPDLLISAGDLVDGQIGHLDGLTSLFREIRPRYGKFAVTGNHEYLAGLEKSLDFTRRAGFTVLRGEALTLAAGINLAGVDDITGLSFGSFEGRPESELLQSLPQDKFTILLKHRPVVEEGSRGLFDLQISGHTHGGQIFPFGLLIRIFFPYVGGFYELPSQGILYVSRGSGTWGPPIRFLTPPEVTLFEFVHEDKGLGKYPRSPLVRVPKIFMKNESF
jgi:predicted MPP superfamily phosphohydrolase